MNIKAALSNGGGWAVAAAMVVGLFVGEQAEPASRADDAFTANSPGGGVTATIICNYPETEVVHVLEESGDKHYGAKFENAEVRYDLTWRAGSAIAVEELRGAEFRIWAEQPTGDFLACIAGKDVREVQEGH